MKMINFNQLDPLCLKIICTCLLFSLSFVQSDIAEGIVAWVNHDINERCNSVVMQRDAKNQIKGKTYDE